MCEIRKVHRLYINRRHRSPVVGHQQIHAEQSKERPPIPKRNRHPEQKHQKKYSIMMLPCNRRSHRRCHRKHQKIYRRGSEPPGHRNHQGHNQQDGRGNHRSQINCPTIRRVPVNPRHRRSNMHLPMQQPVQRLIGKQRVSMSAQITQYRKVFRSVVNSKHRQRKRHSNREH